MRVLVLSQVYYPDTVSVAQHLSDLCDALVAKGCSVDVVSSRLPYYADGQYASKETRKGVRIHRIRHTNFSRNSLLGRGFNFFSFFVSSIAKAIILGRRCDLVLTTSVPPFMATVAMLVSKINGIDFKYWLMDVQPDLAFESGVLERHSLRGRILSFFSTSTLRAAKRVVVLDRHMMDHVTKCGVPLDRVHVLPVWPVSEDFYDGDRLENPFRVEHDYGTKIVVMYSGNHAWVHPLDTLLQASHLLRNDDRFLFSFIGGGIRVRDVSDHRLANGGDNIAQHEFQPRASFHISIAASDIQVVIMGDNQVGYTHPNKIYGALLLAKPVLYIGPAVSHVTDILQNLSGNITVRHGDVAGLVGALQQFVSLDEDEMLKIGKKNREYALVNFKKELLIESTVDSVLN